ncbi:MAG: pyridoxal-5'-phosphate-dependent protein subunit beta, partial [Chloroflexi bacterium]
KGFKDLLSLGIIDKVPVIYSVQAKTSDALYRAWDSGVFSNISTHTVADSICVDIPRNGYHARKLLKDYNGRIIRVTDKAILAAQHELASSSGIFTEPAGAAAYAGFIQEQDQLECEAQVVIITTGNGLKDVASALKGVKAPDKSIKSIQDIL